MKAMRKKRKKNNKTIKKMMFLLRCPKCKNNMKYQTSKPISEKNKKRCVYCGFSMSVRKSTLKKL